MFTYGVHLCARVSEDKVADVCPQLGDRFDTFVNTSLGAVLGTVGRICSEQAMTYWQRFNWALQVNRWPVSEEMVGGSPVALVLTTLRRLERTLHDFCVSDDVTLPR